MTDHACQILSVEKAFGQNKVLRDVSLELPKGEVTVLMGANGAGKSTLVKILCGVQPADAGEIRLFGEIYNPTSPGDAFDSGIVTVHQSINDGVVPDLDVTSNLLLDRLTDSTSGFFMNFGKMHEEARRIASAMQFEVDVKESVANLGIADRQMIAIARAMASNPKILILDEPTSSLSAAEAERLFELIDHLRKSGVAILYISHRMSDVRRIADRIVSMRDGTISGTFEGTPLDYEGAVTAMLGHSMTEVVLSETQRGSAALELKDIRLSDHGGKINLTAFRGEVLAITGLLGSGKSLLASIMFGQIAPDSGEMLLDGRKYRPMTVGDAIGEGVFMCPKDRASNGVIPDFDITGNMTLPFLKEHSSFAILSSRKQKKLAQSMVSTLGIVCRSEADEIGTLSGGNQQKVMVARWLQKPCRVLVLDEPFQGVDIKARRDIGRHVRQTGESRATIVFVSELDEALEIADRIIVMHEQSVVGEQTTNDIDLALMHAQISGQASTGAVAG